MRKDVHVMPSSRDKGVRIVEIVIPAISSW